MVRQVEQVLVDRGREVVQEIVAYAATTRKRRGRRAAVEVLGLLRAPAASDLLLELVRDPDRELRIRVRQGRGRDRGPALPRRIRRAS